MKRTDSYTGPFPRKRHSHLCLNCAKNGQRAVACYKAQCTRPQHTETCQWCKASVATTNQMTYEQAKQHGIKAAEAVNQGDMARYDYQRDWFNRAIASDNRKVELRTMWDAGYRETRQQHPSSAPSRL